MGFWKFNPPEPCGNPPAGHCQCQPCRWKVSEFQGVFQPESDQLAPDPFPVLSGFSRHSAIKLNNGIASDGPPWFRLWRGITGLSVDGSTQPNVYSGWWFGFWRWNLPPGWLPGTRETYGLSFRGFSNDPSGFVAPRTSVPYLGGNMWLHLPGYSDLWKCWGANRLYFMGDTLGDFDESIYVVVEPDL